MIDLQTLILAGGKSRRMGQDKALLSLGEMTLLERTVEIAKNVTHKVWIITPWREEYQPIFSETVQWVDDVNEKGGLVALTHCLSEISAKDWILLLACDLPFLEIQQLQIWRQKLADIPTEYQAALVKRDDYYEPLCGFYRVTVRRSLEKFIGAGGRSFQQWLAAEQVFPLEIEPEFAEKMLFNCNTPEDFATLKANASD